MDSGVSTELISPKTSIQQSDGNGITTGLANFVTRHRIHSSRNQERQIPPLTPRESENTRTD